MGKGLVWQTFCEQITQLVGGGNFNELDLAGNDMLTKPMVLDGVVFGAWSHTTRFKASKGESTDVILMNLDVHATNFVR